jgi:hypothetical protein
MSISFISPEPYSVVEPNSRTIVFNPGNLGEHPSRTLEVKIGSVLLFTEVGGVVTYLDPDYTYSVSDGIYTLTKISNWSIGVPIVVTVIVRLTGGNISDTAALAFYSASPTLLDSAPKDGEIDVRDTTSISFRLSSVIPISYLSLAINGQSALIESPIFKPVWARPNFYGKISIHGNDIHLLVLPRRRFSYLSKVTVDVGVMYEGQGETEAFVHFTKILPFSFHIRGLASDSSQDNADMPVVQATSSGAAAFARAILGVMSPLNPGVDTAALFYSRVQRCSLAGFYQDRRLERAGIVQPDLMELDAKVREADIFWGVFRMEASAKGVADDMLELLDKTYQAPFPQERVGAVAALLLLGFTK